MQLKAYLQQLKSLSKEQMIEPTVEKLGKEQERQLREMQDLRSGAVMSAVVRTGLQGQENHPGNGDMVFIHVDIFSEQDRNIYSTRAGDGPIVLLMGKGLRAPRGWEIGLFQMTKNQINALRIKKDYGYNHPECTLKPPPNINVDQNLKFNIELLHIVNGEKIRALGINKDLYHILQKEGQGLQSPRPPFEVEVKYRIKQVSEGSCQSDLSFLEFDNASVAYTSASATLGQKQLLDGIEEVVTFMSKEERACVLMQGQRLKMRDNCWQVVDIILESFTEVRDMTGDGGVLKRRVKDGQGEFPVDAPLRDCKVTCHLKCKNQGDKNWCYDSKAGDSPQPKTFHTGQGDAPEGLEMCLKLMLKNEVSLLTCNPKWGYAGRTDFPEGIDPNSSVDFEVEMVDFSHDGHVEMMDIAQKLAFVQKLKEQGNILLKDGKHQFAKMRYERAWSILKQSRDIETQEQQEQADNLKIAVLNNLALCCFHLSEFAESIQWCNQVLEIDESNVKAVLRRGRARTMKGDYELSEGDYNQALKMDYSIRQEIEYAQRLNKQKKNEAIKKQKQTFGKFSSK